MDPVLYDYWPSMISKSGLKFGFNGLMGPPNEQVTTEAPLEIKSFSLQINEMNNFLKLLIQICFHRLWV